MKGDEEAKTVNYMERSRVKKKKIMLRQINWKMRAIL